MGGEHQHPPLGGQGPDGPAEHPVQLLGLFLLQQPLAVGRVGHQLAVLAVPVELARIRYLEPDAVLHPGQLRVVPRQLHGLGVDVAAPDVVAAVEFLIHGLVGGVQPQLGVHALPLLGGKAPVQAGGPVFGDEGRLDGDGAAAAEGVAEGVPAPVAGQRHQRRRQCLPQGGTHVLGPVAPLVQTLAGGVQIQRGHVLDNGELNLVPAARLRQRLAAVGGAQPLGGGLFYDGLAGGHGVQRGVQGVALDGELAVPGDELLPGQRQHALEQRLEIPGGKAAQLHQHPGAAAQIDVETGDVSHGAFTVDTAVFRPDVVQLQALHLIRHQGFQPEQAGDRQCHGPHLL